MPPAPPSRADGMPTDHPPATSRCSGGRSPPWPPARQPRWAGVARRKASRVAASAAVSAFRALVPPTSGGGVSAAVAALATAGAAVAGMAAAAPSTPARRISCARDSPPRGSSPEPLSPLIVSPSRAPSSRTGDATSFNILNAKDARKTDGRRASMRPRRARGFGGGESGNVSQTDRDRPLAAPARP